MTVVGCVAYSPKSAALSAPGGSSVAVCLLPAAGGLLAAAVGPIISKPADRSTFARAAGKRDDGERPMGGAGLLLGAPAAGGCSAAAAASGSVMRRDCTLLTAMLARLGREVGGGLGDGGLAVGVSNKQNDHQAGSVTS